jgi:type I restriction enzyme, S subunit
METEQLPEGWAKTELGALIDSMANGVYKPESYYSDDGVPCLRMYNIQDGHIAWQNVKRMRLSPKEVEQYRLLPGDILVNRVNSRELVGKAAICDGFLQATVFESKNIRVRLKRGCAEPKYVNYFLQTGDSRLTISDNSKQTVGMATVSQPLLASLPLPFPPLAEQQRIVAKVEALLDRVNTARHRLAKLPAILERFRQSVLAAACSGRLTADSRENHEQEGDLPCSWQLTEAGRVYKDARYGTSVKCAKAATGTPVLRVPNIARGVLDLSDLKYAELSPKENEILAAREGDVIICRTNGSLDLIGKAAVIPPLSRQHAFASYLIRLRLDKTRVLPNYFHVFLSGPAGRDQIEERARTTAGQFNLNLEILRNLQLPLPPIAEQHEIVGRVRALFQFADAIENRVAAATIRAEKLTFAILAKAFRAELVPTEAELARQEGRVYEPASKLLERIRSRNENDPANIKENPRPRRVTTRPGS